MPALPQSNVHLDILLGRDELLDTPDFMGGESRPHAAALASADRRPAPAGPPPLDIHADMERKLRM
jgi:proteasome maturation protein